MVELTADEVKELDRVLFIARRAASKLFTMYKRGECAPRNEVDELINAEDALRRAYQTLRDRSQL